MSDPAKVLVGMGATAIMLFVGIYAASAILSAGPNIGPGDPMYSTLFSFIDSWSLALKLAAPTGFLVVISALYFWE
ncbi:hypothetical protein RH831_08915 [Halodesulfurarchaeum sp. HSR-GB]|uniref:hypothetical protein n=1 Tax=Halodesulfurarchaeum sp. HSR-GB TaxID=3074077 RepID=UPI002857955B|nr:hypothetical protein [Halodesulfurarchaeum sp. HSR-GB]MDR5657300.1 hypothetical protein [Halodesulfurarchaeum sp. HSR-GB]